MVTGMSTASLHGGHTVPDQTQAPASGRRQNGHAAPGPTDSRHSDSPRHIRAVAHSAAQLARSSGSLPAQLQGHRVLFGVESQKAIGIAMDDGAGGNHLRVQQGRGCQQPVEVAAMPVGPVHHRRNR